jgi:hypothetical protein
MGCGNESQYCALGPYHELIPDDSDYWRLPCRRAQDGYTSDSCGSSAAPTLMKGHAVIEHH